MSWLQRITRALGQPPRRHRPSEGVVSAYQLRLLPDVAEGRVLLDKQTATAMLIPRLVLFPLVGSPFRAENGCPVTR
jgi:hypothetical protein